MNRDSHKSLWQLRRAGTASAPGIESQRRGLAAIPQLAAHHQFRTAALGAGRGLRAAFDTAGISPSCDAPAQTENYSPPLQGAAQRLTDQQLQHGDRRVVRSEKLALSSRM